MGLPAPHLKFILQRSQKYKFSGPILTFGNQDIYATEKDVEDWFTKEKIQFKKPEKILYSSSSDVPKINKEASSYIHAKTFFEFLGISQENYYDIDKFIFDKPKIAHDLQYPIDPKFHNFFNFILDEGTLEHVFDIKSVMDNIVRITKIGGYVLQILPAHNYLNHGFYQFSPTFFYDFYIANGFEIVESYLIEIRGNVHRFYRYDQEQDYTGLFFNPKNRLLNCFLVKKKNNTEKTTLPDQFFYKKLAMDSKSVEGDFNKSNLDKAVNYVRSIIPIKFHGIFFSFWCFLKRVTSKRQYFDIKK